MDDFKDFCAAFGAVCLGVITVFAVIALCRIMFYDPPFNDGFEAGRISMFKDCQEMNQCPKPMK